MVVLRPNGELLMLRIFISGLALFVKKIFNAWLKNILHCLFLSKTLPWRFGLKDGCRDDGVAEGQWKRAPFPPFDPDT